MPTGSGILVVAAQRELRRRLFDALDRHQQPVYLARDAAQAASLLEQREPLELLVVAVEGHAVEAQTAYSQLRRIPACAEARMIAVLADGATATPAQLPPEVDDWLHSAQVEKELPERWQRLRSARTALRQRTALSMLTRLFRSGSSGDGVGEASQLLIDELGLDYFALWPAPSAEGGAPVPRFQWSRDNPQSWPEASAQPSLQQALNGAPVLRMQGTAALAAQEPLIRQFGLNSFAGLPLLDEHDNVLGALLAGSRQKAAELELAESLLSCAATYFAHRLELQRIRELGRAEALRDALTGLPNQLLLGDRLETIVREARRNSECFALLFVDLDHFKSINRGLGQAVGDQMLAAVAQRLRVSVRESDTVARYAGDEFVVVLRHIFRNKDVARTVEKIVYALETPLRLDSGVELQARASIGISLFPDDAQDAETLLKHANQAMRTAKEQGRRTYRYYQVNPEQAHQQNLMLKSRLRHAQQNDELRVLYQPQVNTLSEDIVGMEALLRWDHPQLGAIGPTLFVPLAEETGLIVPIGEWLLRTACQQAQAWQQQYGLLLRLGVNLSAVQLMQPNLLELVAKVLHETGLDPGLLELEVTESISIKQTPNLLENLHGLQQLGCSIAIDDFGTGAASLDYLRRLPANRIKIDQSFVRNIGVDPDDEAIVRATIEMAHQLNRTVVAEGVEIEQHLHFLRASGCDELQGYLFCQPLTPAKFDKLISERKLLAAG